MSSAEKQRVEERLVGGHQLLLQVGQANQAELVAGSVRQPGDASPAQREVATLDLPDTEVFGAEDLQLEAIHQPSEGRVGVLPVDRRGARDAPVGVALVAHQEDVPGAQGEQAGLVEVLSHRERLGEGASARSLYLHIPFCVSKCPYCDFNSHVGLQHLYRSYARALVEEIRAWGRELGHGPLDTVFIGGGTPSLVPAEDIRAILDAVRGSFDLQPGAEVTMEANPQSAEAARMESWLEAGVNRLSMGIQSLDNDALRFLERAHDASEALEVMAMARHAGFRGISFDLIFAIPGLSTARWREVLAEALSLRPDHLSAYELTPEEGTRLGADVASGKTVLPDDDTRVAQYEMADEMLGAAGLERYEVSNWALPGHQCRHNLTYWSGRPYAAAGAGAHAFAIVPRTQSWLGEPTESAVTGRQWNLSSPAAYINSITKRGHAVGGSEWLDLPTTAFDLVMMGLRLERGMAVAEIDALVPGFAELIRPTTARLVDGGLLEEAGGRLRATSRGRAVLNLAIAEFLPSKGQTGKHRTV